MAAHVCSLHGAASGAGAEPPHSPSHRRRDLSDSTGREGVESRDV